MKTRIILITYSIFAIFHFSGCTPPAHDALLRNALREVLSPEAKRSETIDVLAALKDTPDIVPVIKTLGTNNFTMFFLTLQKDSPLLISDAYDCIIPETDISELGKYIGVHATAIALQDINDLTYTTLSNGTGIGSFTVKVSWGFSATFLFKTHDTNRKIYITKLVIKRKDSKEIDDGFVIAQRE